MWVLRGIGLTLWSVALGAAVMWPVWAPWLTLGLVAYGVILHFRPAACLVIIPAAAAVLDFSLLTGFEATDELDLLALASVGSLLLCARVGVGLPRLPAGLWPVVVLFTLSLVVSSALALQATLGQTEPGITAYMSGYNILRAIKGFVLALLIFLLLPQTGVSPGEAFRQYFVPGMVLGLLLICVVVIWERAAYPGLLNVDSGYRVSGLFTEMRVGGPSIEAFLVLTLPFSLIWLWARPGWFRLLVVLALLAGGLYAMLVTYSRAGYLGVAVIAVVLSGFGLIALRRGQRRAALIGVASVLVVAGIVVGVAMPHTEGYAAQRLGEIEADLNARVTLWERALDLRQPGLLYATLGHGPGTYPRQSRMNSPPGELPANFLFRTDGSDGQLVLGTGQSVYINQRVPWFAGDTLEMEVSGRTETPASLWFFLCQKHVRYAYACETQRVRFPADTGEAHATTVTFSTGALGQPQGFPPRHLALTVRNFSRGSVINLEAVQLRDQAGRELLRNADFAAGSRHWYYTTYDLDIWRTENQWLELYFEQGWLGLTAFVLLTLVAFLYLFRRAIHGDHTYAFVLSALLGLLTIGIFSTVFFSPRVMMLFYLALLLALSTMLMQPQSSRFRDARAA